jgi:hypothetical protein
MSTPRIAFNGWPKERNPPGVFVLIGIPRCARDVLKAHDVIPAIHVDSLARNAAAQRRAEKERGVADFFDIHIASERSMFRVILEHLPEVAHGPGCQGHHGAGRNGVDADIFRAEAVGQVTDRGLERRFGNTHYVVTLARLFRRQSSSR